MVAGKLLVSDIIMITACVKQICLLGVSFEQKNIFFRIYKHSLEKQFAFLKNFWCQYLNFVLSVTYCFLRDADWPTNNFLGIYCYFPVIRLVSFDYTVLNGAGTDVLWRVFNTVKSAKK